MDETRYIKQIVAYLAEQEIKATEEEVDNIHDWMDWYTQETHEDQLSDFTAFITWFITKTSLSEAQVNAVRAVCHVKNFLYTGIASHALFPEV